MKIVITGASNGLGAALAKAYAAPEVKLFLTGRHETRLAEVAAACRAKGAEVEAVPLDVTDAAALGAWLQGLGALDLVIANAGISAGTGGGGETLAQAQHIIDVNVSGVLNTILPVIPAMKMAGRGQLAIISSLAGFRGMPGAPAYCASKAFVRLYGEALGPELAAYGIKVSVVCPGFIKTPMTDVNDFPMPLLMSAERGAALIKAQLAKGKARIAFPWPIYAAVRLLAGLPVPLVDWLLRKAPQKPRVKGL